jgi:hypothetical protein
VEYLCLLILLLFVCSLYFIFCQTCIKIHFYCVDLLFIFFSLTVEMKLMRSRCVHIEFLRLWHGFLGRISNLNKLINLSLVTSGETLNTFFSEFITKTKNKSPKLWLIILFGSSSQTRVEVHEMHKTQTENFVQVNVSQAEFLCHSLFGS